MSETLVVDASVAIKWVVQEEDTSQAVSLRRNFGFVAPDLLIAECANILWKKTRRSEMTAKSPPAFWLGAISGLFL